ncbi:MAG: NAD(P)H-dependent oxidoreductase [Deltaproteobacteria bacterium]|nr:NAD(P)H-dependent oxidoreductase [Deltaproteobacteria bacterium]MBW1735954.1 NAD(P)H-dependent oxidoreductase [Deltaproteobacteria bacterium]MBW1908263.1 NAD(P)H-dependent oxidoreductase [Deltaproteobacteria bacterium]MBW2032245.1 NAD(P)H-dependent oxidoreductase [Deltaproteobacteria bacterium]MBW2113258.1 NAD(P)H-dependent oxidoreductase [Deltaproteobacteria bacterium]
MKRAAKIFFGAGAWPSIAIYWGLMLGLNFNIFQATLGALLYAVGYSLIAIGGGRITKLDYGVVLFWTAGLGLSLFTQSFSQLYLLRYFTTFLYISLFLMAYLPVVFGAEPFTIAFAKRTTPEMFWETDLFITINRIMTLVWAGLFLMAMLITLIPGVITQIIIPIVLVMSVGIPFTMKFPDRYLEAKGMGGMKALAEPAASSVTSTASTPAGIPAVVSGSGDQERKTVAEKLGSVKNVHVVFGSPRNKRGFTFKSLDRFLDGIRAGGITPEIHFLSKYKIRPCTGCYTCWTKTPGVCIQKDDMTVLNEKLEGADLIVYAQPLYVFSVPGITKNFLDRRIPILEPFLIENSDGSTRHPHRGKGTNCRRMLIFSVCGFPEVDHFDGLIKMFRLMSRSGQTPIIGEILRPSSESMRFGERIGGSYQRIMDAFFEAGRQVVTQGYVSRDTEQDISQPLMPTVQGFRQMGNRFWNTWIRYEEEKKAGKELPQFEEYLQADMGMFFGGMASVYNPAKAGDFEGIFQFDIAGDQAGKCYLQIKDKQCTFNEGEAENPGIIIHTPWDVWLSIGQGEISGQDALMQGKYTVDGDLGLMLKMQEIFSS